jgi:hypothetical protein
MYESKGVFAKWSNSVSSCSWKMRDLKYTWIIHKVDRVVVEVSAINEWSEKRMKVLTDIILNVNMISSATTSNDC